MSDQKTSDKMAANKQTPRRASDAWVNFPREPLSTDEWRFWKVVLKGGRYEPPNGTDPDAVEPAMVRALSKPYRDQVVAWREENPKKERVCPDWVVLWYLIHKERRSSSYQLNEALAEYQTRGDRW